MIEGFPLALHALGITQPSQGEKSKHQQWHSRNRSCASFETVSLHKTNVILADSDSNLYCTVGYSTGFYLNWPVRSIGEK